jgi:ATP-dependent helicase/nuclease subunit A
VGDPQQSIYRFRGADVEQFVRMEEAIRDRQGLSLRLTRCFRSQARLVGFFNHTFAQVFAPLQGAPLEPVRPDDSPAPAVECLFVSSQAGAAEARAAEADHLARRLRQLLDSGEQVVGTQEAYRAAGPGDMAILFRAMTDVGIYEQALRRWGIPFYTVAGSGFFARQEVLDVLNLLRLLRQPHDHLALAAVLRAPWVGCSDAVLFWAAAEDAWDDLRAARFRERIGPEEGARLDGFLEWFESLRARQDQLPIAGLLAESLQQTLYRAALAAQPEGPQALGNVRKLVELARQFDSGPAAGLHGFVAHLEERLAHTPREAEATLELESGDTVKLMSVHQSKGLEWPVVAVADLNRPFQLPGGANLLWAPSIGLGLKLRDDQLQMEAGPEYRRVQEQLTQLELAEQQRVLYVAATRAKDRLILSGAYNPDEFTPSLAKGKSWLQWLGEIYPIGAAFSYPTERGTAPVRVELPPELPPVPVAERGLAYPELIAQIREAASPAGPDPAGWQRQLIPPEPGRPAQRVAVTDLELFALCPRRYQLHRLLRLPEEAGVSELSQEEADLPEAAPAPAVGQLVHQLMALLPAAARPGDLAGLVETALRQQGFAGAQSGAELGLSAIQLLEKSLTAPRWEEVRACAERRSEVPFVLQLAGERCLVGRFDLLYRDAAGAWRVLDYKTDRIAGTAAQRVQTNYKLQQEAYGLAASRLLGGEVAEVVFAFLRTGEEVVWRPTRSSVAEAESHLSAVLAAWDSALGPQVFAKTEERQHCSRCGYRPWCKR